MARYVPLTQVPLVAAFMAAPLFVFSLVFLSEHRLSLERVSLQTLIVSVIFYPVCEEIIFRGLIQRELLKKKYAQKNWGGISLANCLANVFFTLVHLFFFRDLAALFVFFPGLIFGYFFDRYQGVAHPIVLHGFYNLIGLLTLPLW